MQDVQMRSRCKSFHSACVTTGIFFMLMSEWEFFNFLCSWFVLMFRADHFSMSPAGPGLASQAVQCWTLRNGFFRNYTFLSQNVCLSISLMGPEALDPLFSNHKFQSTYFLLTEVFSMKKSWVWYELAVIFQSRISGRLCTRFSAC